MKCQDSNIAFESCVDLILFEMAMVSPLPTMSISLGSCLILTIIISIGNVPCLAATFPLQGCQTDDIDLLLVADDIFSPDDGQMFFTELLDHFLSPDEVLLTRLRVAMVVAGMSDGPGLLFSFQSYNTTDEVKKHLKADPIVKNPRFSTDATFQYICDSHYEDVMEGFRQNVTHIAVVVVGNVWHHEMLRDLYHSYSFSCRFEMFLVLFGHDIQENVLLQIAETKNQIYLPTLEVDNALSVKLCNRCNVKAWSIPHQSLQYQQSCYFLHVHETPMTWFEASSQCKILGGQLVSIEAEEELQFLELKLNNYDQEVYIEQIADLGYEYFGKVYIGLVRDTTRIGSPFLWINNNPLIYTHWVNTLPNGGPNQRCGLWVFRRITEWSISLNRTIYNASDLEVNYNGWKDMGCGSRFTNLALCEIIIRRNQVEYQIKQIPKASPANMDSFTSAVTRGEFSIFQDKIVSIPAFVGDLTYASFLKKTGSMFRVFRCHGEDDNTNIIPYSYVCDHIAQCDFGQDENRCWHRPCDLDAEFTCSSGQCVSLESRCDVYTDCYDGSDEEGCQFCNSAMCCDGSCLPRHFVFNGEIDCVGCDSVSSYFNDGIEHDESSHTDEGLRDYDCPFVCNRSECVTPSMLNDGITQCLGPEGPLDEIWGKLETVNSCKISYEFNGSLIEFVRWSPRCVYIKDRYGTVIGCRDMSHLHDCQNFTCPEGYVKCPDSYCIPLHLVGDGLKDCLMGEDELLGMNVNCTGNFECWGGKVCVHPDFVCDGYPHCPSGDDELNCHVSCAEGFRCIGGTVTVTDFEKSKPLQDLTFIDKRTRFLDLSGVNLSKTASAGNEDALKNVVEMYLSNCQIRHLDENMVSDFSLTGVYTLDLSHNLISTLSDYSMLSFMYNLRVLDLSHNKLLASMVENAFNVIYKDTTVDSHSSKSLIETLNLAFTAVSVLEKTLLDNLPKLKYLNLSHTYITIIDQQSFPQEFLLDTLDLRHTPLSNIEPNALTTLSVSKDLYSDLYKLCCPQVRGQGIPEHVCHAPASAISSCMDLIQEPAQRVLLWTVGVLAVTGNLVVITYRLLWDRAVLKKSYGLFVTNLSVSDLFMGVYLLIIAGTDVIYRDNYVWYESDWRHSTLCQTAGFLSTLSSETSAFFILLVTIDRFLVIRFPFGHFRFTKWSMIISCVIAWSVGFVLALVPVLPRFQHWQMYSSNGMCLGLPLTPDRRSGWEYSAALFIGLNFILFLFIACGQYLIYRAMAQNSLKTSSAVQGNAKRVQEIMVAKQLSIVVLSDFLCWFPIGIMGLLALSGRDIGTEVYAWSAVLVLPINSALNPVLYTVPLIMKKWENFKYGNNKAKTNSSFKSRESTRETDTKEIESVKL